MPDVQMTFTEHLAELRTRLIRAIVAVVICTIVAYMFHNPILVWIQRPLPPEAKLQAIDLVEPFMAPIRLAIYTGMVVSFPVVLYQALMFCLPALLPHERRVVLGSIGTGVVLFYAGVAFASFYIVPAVVGFMAGYLESVQTAFAVRAYVDRVFQILMGFGAAFQLPMVMFALMRLGIVSPETLARQRRYVIVGLFVLAALLTPPDPMSQVVMALPLYALFEISLFLGRMIPKRKADDAA